MWKDAMMEEMNSFHKNDHMGIDRIAQGKEDY